tara:strand:+ start:600 stop:1385 length:786 start_codon:yes stop_codon:yes gene_type:complete
MKKLIVNADDFGCSWAVNGGIIQAHEEGIVSSTTAMANMKAFPEAMKLAKKYPSLGVGVHLNIIDGEGLATEHPLGKEFAVKVILGKISRREIEEEFRAQVAAVDKHLEITHLDTHQHQGVFPHIRKAMVSVAKEFKVKKLRLPSEKGFSLNSQLWKKCLIDVFVPATKRLYKKNGLITTQEFYGILNTGGFSVSVLEHFLKQMKDSAEVMVHPGKESSYSPLKGDFLVKAKHKELAALVDPGAKDLLKKYNVKLVSYRDL